MSTISNTGFVEPIRSAASRWQPMCGVALGGSGFGSADRLGPRGLGSIGT